MLTEPQKKRRWLVTIGVCLAVCFLIMALMSTCLYYYAHSTGALDVLGAVVEHPTLLSQLGAGQELSAVLLEHEP